MHLFQTNTTDPILEIKLTVTFVKSFSHKIQHTEHWKWAKPSKEYLLIQELFRLEQIMPFPGTTLRIQISALLLNIAGCLRWMRPRCFYHLFLEHEVIYSRLLCM